MTGEVSILKCRHLGTVQCIPTLYLGITFELLYPFYNDALAVS